MTKPKRPWFDYDLCSGRIPVYHEKHGVTGAPRYVDGAGFSFEAKTGNFQLAPDSPGIKKGEIIPNICDMFNGAPDGAQQSGTPPMSVGVKAEFVPPAMPGKNADH